MRTNKFFKTGLLLFVASLGLISCGDDDKEPEIVIDPVSENVEYYIEGKVDFLDKYNMSDFISLIEKLSYTFSMYHNDKTNKIIMHTLQGENIRKITETLCVSNHTVLDSQNEFYNYVLANVRSL